MRLIDLVVAIGADVYESSEKVRYATREEIGMITMNLMPVQNC